MERGVAQFRVRRSSGEGVSYFSRPKFKSRLGTPREVFPTEEEMERNLGDWRRMNVRVLCEFDGTDVRTKISK
jgi:hypothetical protein